MFYESTLEKVSQPFFIGEEIQFKANQGELPEEVLENGLLIGDVVEYKTISLTDYLVLRYGYWKDDDTYVYRFFELPRESWNRIEEYYDEDDYEVIDKDDNVYDR